MQLGTPRRWATFVLGATLLALGVATSVSAGAEVDVGVGSWQALETGLVTTTGAGFGVVVVVESLLALLLAYLLFRVRPGPATLVVAVVVGPAVQALLGVLPVPTTVPGAVGMLALGTVVLGLGVGLYVAADLGPSAQDALFVGMFTRLPLRPITARLLLDGLLALGGLLLGGQTGPGTLVVLLVLPPLVDAGLALGRRFADTDVGATPMAEPAAVPGP